MGWRMGWRERENVSEIEFYNCNKKKKKKEKRKKKNGRYRPLAALTFPYYVGGRKAGGARGANRRQMTNRSEKVVFF